jgi:signal transduction histidine kinase
MEAAAMRVVRSRPRRCTVADVAREQGGVMEARRRRRSWYAPLDRVLSLGLSEGLSSRQTRHVRVTNALALIGFVVSLGSAPLDAISGTPPVLANDFLGSAAFASCWLLNARGRRTIARVVLLCAANAEILAGVTVLGNVAELRTMFFPLALMPFLVFSVKEWGWLLLFVALPVAGYFITGQMQPPQPSLAISVYEIYSPVLSFILIVTGTYVFAAIDDNVQRKLLQARAREAQSARLVALGEMSSGIAHEIRNPLAAIQLAAAQIAEHPDDAAQAAQLGERIQKIVRRASRIIETLRSFARDASADPFVDTPVERVLEDTLELCKRRFVDHGIELTVTDVAPDLVVECRPVQLSQVLVNLLTNAFDAVESATERWVRIDVATVDDQLEIAVTDSGAGIPASTRTSLFEPFFTTKGPDRGTGLGLSL